MMTPPVGDKNELRAKLACAYAGAVWGVFWFPLRELGAAGVAGPWPTVLFFCVPTIIFLPLAVWRWRGIVAAGWRPQLIGFVAGSAMAIYSISVLYTEVVRAMLLYYTTPIWCILLARAWLGERITPGRAISMVIGLAGMLVILHVDTGFPWPENLGDWLGLASGLIWAVAAVLMRETPDYNAIDLTWSFLFWAAVGTTIMATLPFAPPAPQWSSIVGTLPWLAPVTLVVVIPALFAVMWGAPKLNPGVVGLLFMTEITVGAVTAALWANEPFGMREFIGVVLISFAGVFEILFVPICRLLRGTDRTAGASGEIDTGDST